MIGDKINNTGLQHQWSGVSSCTHDLKLKNFQVENNKNVAKHSILHSLKQETKSCTYEYPEDNRKKSIT